MVSGVTPQLNTENRAEVILKHFQVCPPPKYGSQYIEFRFIPDSAQYLPYHWIRAKDHY